MSLNHEFKLTTCNIPSFLFMISFCIPLPKDIWPCFPPTIKCVMLSKRVPKNVINVENN